MSKKTPVRDTVIPVPVKGFDFFMASNSTWRHYLQGVRTEWGKVSWPTWPQVWVQTIVVLIMTTVMSLGLWAIDNLFRLVIQLVTKPL